MTHRLVRAALACSAALSVSLSLSFAHAAGDAASAPPAGHPPGPPPEAVAACVGKTEGALVSFTLRNGASVSGVCHKLGDVLAARPADGGMRPPPPPAR